MRCDISSFVTFGLWVRIRTPIKSELLFGILEEGIKSPGSIIKRSIILFDCLEMNRVSIMFILVCDNNVSIVRWRLHEFPAPAENHIERWSCFKESSFQL